jgi:hypothetical protein
LNSGSRLKKLGNYLPKAVNVLATIAITATATTAATAISAAAAAAIPATTTAAAAAGRTLLTGTRFIDGQGTALEFFAMVLADGCVCFSLGAHFDECETTRTTCGTILHDVDCDDCACTCKMILEIVFGGTEGEVTYEQFSRHYLDTFVFIRTDVHS